MAQDNLTVEKIQEWRASLTVSLIKQCNDAAPYVGERELFTTDCFAVIDSLLKQVESLKLSLSGKTNFDEVAELKRQVKSQDEITAALHIVNAELGRRVESQKEEITALNSRMHTCPECGTENGTHHSAACVDKRNKEVVEQTARDCVEIAKEELVGANKDDACCDRANDSVCHHIIDAIRTKYSLPKEE